MKKNQFNDMIDIIHSNSDDKTCCALLDQSSWSDSAFFMALLTQNVIERPALQTYLFGRLMIMLPVEQMQNIARHLGAHYQSSLQALSTSIFKEHYPEKVMRLLDITFDVSPIDLKAFDNIAALTRYIEYLKEDDWKTLQQIWRNNIEEFKNMLEHYTINRACYDTERWTQFLLIFANTNLQEAVNLVVTYPYLFDVTHPTIKVFSNLGQRKECDISRLWAAYFEGRSEYDVVMWYFYNKDYIHNSDVLQESIHKYIMTHKKEFEWPAFFYILDQTTSDEVQLSYSLVQRLIGLRQKNKTEKFNIVNYVQSILEPSEETLQAMSIIFTDDFADYRFMTHSDFLKIRFMADALMEPNVSEKLHEEHLML